MTVHCQDNLEVMRGMESESVDLIATDPPYNTGRDFGAYNDRRNTGFLDWLAERVREMHRLLKPTGSLYLQCDSHESHYIKMDLDGIFGRANFRNEIIWSYRRWPAKTRQYQKTHDTIFFYSKDGGKHFWGDPMEPKSEVTPKFKQKAGYVDDGRGGKRRINIIDKSQPSLDTRMRDVWEIRMLAQAAKERTGYPTQKPVALYERIIKASCPDGGLVLDPFCGSGTTLVAAKRLGRRYVGIDENPEAAKIAEHRLAETQG